MNNLVAVIFAAVVSLFLALSMAPELEVCVRGNDPLIGVVPNCGES